MAWGTSVLWRVKVGMSPPRSALATWVDRFRASSAKSAPSFSRARIFSASSRVGTWMCRTSAFSPYQRAYSALSMGSVTTTCGSTIFRSRARRRTVLFHSDRVRPRFFSSVSRARWR